MRRKTGLILFCCLFVFLGGQAQQTRNKTEREQWFMNLGLGMFIHWSFDSQVGAVISHSMAGASEDYLQRFIHELPATFNPKKFDPDEWATLARLAGMKYVVFTTKHHSGFCMWDTKTTSFNIMNTPFKRDIVREVFDAFRRQGIAIGIYFSPEDFNYLYEHGIPIGRMQHPLHFPDKNPGLMRLDKAQLKELLTQYGPIDLLFFDGLANKKNNYNGPAVGLKEYAWLLQPDVVVTRGQMETPEQTLPDRPLPGPWEACFTMGTDWQYKPTNDPHKSGTEILNMLIQIRAKGGNLLLNVGPKPNGEIQIEQEALLRELALWRLVNGEAIYDVRPFQITREGDIWFTRVAEDSTVVYAFVPGGTKWPYASRKDFLFKTIRATEQTRINVLGFGSNLVEYKKDFDARLYFDNTPMGLQVSAVNGQRLYTNNAWPNPVVLKMEHVRFVPPTVYKEEKIEIEGAK